jgi:hypothetical protein
MQTTQNSLLDYQQTFSRYQYPYGLMSGSAAARYQWLRVRISPVAWMYVSWECCVVSGRGLCVGQMSPADESYRVWCDCVWQLEGRGSSAMKRMRFLYVKAKVKENTEN